MSFDQHVYCISTAVSPVTSPICPLSQKSGFTHTNLTGPSYSSSPATPADRQNRRGTRRFTSPVPSTSTSSKRARMDNDSVASVASADLSLFLNDSINTPSTSPYDEFLAMTLLKVRWGPGLMDLDLSSSVGTSRATCNLHSRPGWTGTSRNAWRMLWSVP